MKAFSEQGTSWQEPPATFLSRLKHLGPGLIVSGSIVGSGELIATTALGAQVGFVALWVILLSCVIKVVVQEELGRYTMSSGETTFRALDKVPGRIGPTSWVVWCWGIMFLGLTLLSGGIVGGVGQVMNLAFPQLSSTVWMFIVAILTAGLLIFKGKFGFIQGAVTVMVFSFTMITLACAILLQWTPYPVHWANVVEGLKLKLPPHGLQIAFAVFGITGISAAELVMYPYWCLEKGYARHVGQRDDTEAWPVRAKGWLKVLNLDVLIAMIFYTIATVAFYFLGAAVLHAQGSVPDGSEMVRTLSQIYTATLGPGAFILFLAGAFAVLYSTLFVHAASYPRLLIDFFELLGILRVGTDEKKRWKWLRLFTLLLITLYVFWYLLLEVPVKMVLISGVLQSFMLPILAGSTLYLRYKHLDQRLKPSKTISFLLWISAIAMLAFAIYSFITLLQKL
ncbi:MAG: Nramp family divalent metal transporter [bacterium]